MHCAWHLCKSYVAQPLFFRQEIFWYRTAHFTSSHDYFDDNSDISNSSIRPDFYAIYFSTSLLKQHPLLLIEEALER